MVGLDKSKRIGRVLVAVPAYRCAPQIPRVLNGFRESEGLLSKVHKIVVIDNRSTDETIRSASDAIVRLGLIEKAQVIRNCENYGLGGSQKVAFEMAVEGRFDYVAILHGDNQALTEELADLLEVAERDPNLSAVLGARFMRLSRLDGYSQVRRWGNRALNLIYSVLTLHPTFDLGSGLNLFKVSDLPMDELATFSDSFTFNMDLLLSYYRRGKAVEFLPITWSETDQVSNARTFKVGWISLVTVLKWRFGLRNKLPAKNYRFELTT